MNTNRRLLVTRALIPAFIVPAFAAWSAPAGAQVVINPNTISGHVRFTNTDTTVVALLQQIGMDTIQVYATSTSPSGYTSRTAYLKPISPLEAAYTISAEADAGGPSGVTYDLSATGWVYRFAAGHGDGQFYFPTLKGVALPPKASQPGL